MAISRANIGKEIKMSGNKKVTKYKKGKQIHKKRKRKGLLDPKDKEEMLWKVSPSMFKPTYFGRDKTKKPWGTPKIQKKKEGGMILDANFVASFYD